MDFHHPLPTVMTNTDQFFVRVCNCGVVHMSFGPTVINVSIEVAIAITETLREVSAGLRKRIQEQLEENAVLFSRDNVVQGRFLKATTIEN